MRLPLTFRSLLRRSLLLRALSLCAFLPALLLAAPAARGAEPQAGRAPAPTGAVVEKVEKGWAGERAGLLPGDEISAWLRPAVAGAPAVRGAIRTPLDLTMVERDQALFGPVTLEGSRGGEARSWTLGRDYWMIGTRPAFAPEELAALARGREAIVAGSPKTGEEAWRPLLATLRTTSRLREAAWLLVKASGAYNFYQDLQAADRLLDEALALVAGDPEGEAFVRNRRCNALRARNDLAGSLACYRDLAERLRRAAGGPTLAEAQARHYVSDVQALTGDAGGAAASYRETLALYRTLAPLSPDLADTFNGLGNLELRLGDFDAATEAYRRAEEIYAQVDPDGFLHASVLANLGSVAWLTGDGAGAETAYRQALPIFETGGHQDGSVRTLNNLAEVARGRGDLARSEDLLRQALRLLEATPGDHLEEIDLRSNLGETERLRGDLEGARESLRRAVALAERLVPGTPELAQALQGYGGVARRLGAYGEARATLERALALREAAAAESVFVAAALLQLGELELAAGSDPQAGAARFERARALLASKAPGSPALATALRGLGDAAAKRGDRKAALDFYRQALARAEESAGETGETAALLQTLGRAEIRAGQARDGEAHLCAALDVLDHQRRRLGGSGEARAGFESTSRHAYFDCAAARLAAGRPEEAFRALERGRARAFLDLVAERDLDLAGVAPELESERRKLDAEYDRVQDELAQATAPLSRGEIDERRIRLRELRGRQEDVARRIRSASPRFASVHYPEPVDLAGAQRALDPGTVLLAYEVGAERSFLFVLRPSPVGRQGLSVHPIPAGERELRARVEAFRALLRNGRTDRAALDRQAEELYRTLLAPARAAIAPARRLVLLADGPLLVLPFAALRREGRYLAEEKPLHTVLSATVYAELQRRRRAAGPAGEPSIAAFADPHYPASSSLEAPGAAAPEVRDALRSGFSLVPLPSSRREVEALGALYPQARLFVGAAATEEQVRAVAPQEAMLHFACHGLLDRRFPLNSGLVLSLPERLQPGADNGLLQAWEILQGVRLDADLVTLSACDTALGVEMGGEGLVGLTRAFQVAGARSVLASSWSVGDASTTRLMQRFYGYLKQGATKDEALRRAQLDLIRSAQLSHPFHWAAFQLFGDWR